jgi:predicted XRE-type DNA-binding protein
MGGDASEKEEKPGSLEAAHMGTTNIYADHGYSAEDATVLALRSDVAGALREATNGIKQREAAERLGIAQGDLSKIRNGHIDSLSLERLIRLCVRLGIDCAAQWGGSPHWAIAVRGAAAELARACADTRMEDISIEGIDDLNAAFYWTPQGVAPVEVHED